MYVAIPFELTPNKKTCHFDRSGGTTPTRLPSHPETPSASRPPLNRTSSSPTSIKIRPRRPTSAKRPTPVAPKNSQFASSNQNGHALSPSRQFAGAPSACGTRESAPCRALSTLFLSLCAVFQTYFSSFQQLPHSFALSGWGGRHTNFLKGHHEPHHD